MATSDIDIVNKALASFGSRPIQTFSATTPAGAAAALLYPMIVAGLLAEYPWSFTKITAPLAQVALDDLADGLNIAGWRNAFRLPADRLALPIKMAANSRIPDAPEIAYEIQGDLVFTNQTALWALYQAFVPELQWPAYFEPAAAACVAAGLVMAVSGNASIKDKLEAIAWGSPAEQRSGGLLGMAKRADARNQPSRVLLRSPLIDVRLSTISIVPSTATP